MADPGVAPIPNEPDGARELRLMAMARAPASQIAQEQAHEEELQRQAGMSKTDIDRYWGRTIAPNPEVGAPIAHNLTRTAAAQNGNLNFLTDPVGSVSAMFGLDPKGVKETLDATADNFTAPIVGAWKGLETQQSQNWQHAFHPTLADEVAPQATAAYRAGATLFAGANVVASPLVGAIATVAKPVGKLAADAGAPLPHVDVDLKSPGSNIADPTQWQFSVRGATKGEAEQGYGDILTGVGAVAVGGLRPGAKATSPFMPEEMRTLAVQQMRDGKIIDPINILQHGPVKITPEMRVLTPGARDFAVAAQRFLPPGTSEEAVLRVTHTLQDTWASTGVNPAEIVRRAMTDGTLREELLTQNIVGDAVTPVHNSLAPKPLARAGEVEAAETKVPGVEARPGSVYVKSVDEGMGLMQALEGSPDIAGKPQVSRTGAVGRFQIEPSTAAHYGFDPNRLNEPAYNAQVARSIVTDLYRRYGGNSEAMAIAYNDGPGRANAWLRAGPGTRLEALRDNSVRGGWRYVRMQAGRDEAFMPLETQEYVARARFKMGASEEGSVAVGPEDYTPPKPAEVPAEVEARQALDDEQRAAAEERVQEQQEKITSGGISAQSVWDDAPVRQAYDEIGSTIGEPNSEAEPVKGLSEYDRAITAIMSRLQPAKAMDDLVKTAVGIDPEKEFSVLDAFRQAAHSDDRAKVAMGFNYANQERGGVLVRQGEGVKVLKNSATARGALQQAIKDGGNPEDFMKWLVARRAVALESVGTETPHNLMAAQRVMREADEAKKYEKASATWDAFTKGVRDYAQASGRYSEAQIEGMENADLGTWVSFNKLAGRPAGVSPRGFTVGSPVKGMKGSTEGMIGDPLSNSLDNVRAMFRSADNNYAVAKLVSLAEQNPDLAATLGLRKLEGRGADPNVPAVEAEMKAYGIPEDKWDAAHDAIATLMQDRESLKDNEFAFYRNGIKEVWQSGWPELADMIKGSTPVQVGAITRIFQTIAHVTQGSVVALPDFALKMFASHQMVQFINDPLHPPPVFTGTSGLIKLMGMDGLLEDAMANGALGSSMRELDRDNVHDTMTQVLGETGWFDRIRNDVGNYKAAPNLKAAAQIGSTTVLTPFRMMRAIGERFDMGNRIGLKSAAEAKGMTSLKAGAHAAEYGIDYTNRGASTLVNWWSSMVPFMRASLLYSEQALKAIERTKPGYYAGYAGYAALAVTMPKMVLYGLNMMADEIPPGSPGYIPDNEKYRNLSAAERMYYYITPPIMGQRLKLRMPDFAAFPFGAVPEAIMSAMYEHDPVKFKDFFTTFMRDYIPQIAPPAVKAPLEVATNTSLDTWQPLTPASMTGTAGELRYIAETSGPARALARILGPGSPTIGVGHIPPMAAIEHIVDGWGDGPGQQVLSALGAPQGRPGAPMDVTKLPFVNSFIVAHPEGGRALSDFYDEKDKFDQWAQAKTELRHEARRGDMTNISQFGPEAIRYANASRRVEAASIAIGRMRDALYGIDANRTMSDDEKLTRTHMILNSHMIPTALAWTKAMREADGQ